MIALCIVLKSNDCINDLDISNNILSTSGLTQSISNDVMMHLSRSLDGNDSLKQLNLSKLGITDWSTCDSFAAALLKSAGLENLDLG